MRPLPHETTASYLNRLAHTYRTTTADLLDGLGITTGTRTAPAAPGTAELHLDTTAQLRLAAFTRTPPDNLAQALPHLTNHPSARLRTPSTNPGPAGATVAGAAPRATAAWQPLEPGEQPVRACPACTRRHTQGATGHALLHPPPHQALCPLHQHWSLDPRHSLDTRALPELTAAHSSHQRLNRHPRAATATSWATAITTRWYDQQTHLTNRWQHRLKRLTDANPHAAPTGRSWALYARTLVTYPETITLARALAQARLPDQPRQGPLPATHPAITAFLHHTAHQLHLPRLAPPPTDLLWTWIHQARPTNS
ncbi:TniQ family protein [Streptomyces sp. NPDC015032]|uniref:TniQ family protein n=1 Tax=Streptomyces sp. NPDC015032 TaxID=3364937 RepID=UPI0037012A6A